MQTFLPFTDYIASARCLDDKRLNKQIVEAYQILTGRVPCSNHPACLMWKEYPDALTAYIVACSKEYLKRTGKDHRCSIYVVQVNPVIYPSWGGDRLFHLSHKINLLRKNYDWYAPRVCRIFDPSNDIYPEGYYWPVEPVGKKAKQDRENWKRWFLQKYRNV